MTRTTVRGSRRLVRTRTELARTSGTLRAKVLGFVPRGRRGATYASIIASARKARIPRPYCKVSKLIAGGMLRYAA